MSTTKKDCQISEWTDWSNCSKPCGPGIQTQTRTIIKKPSKGGLACPTELKRTKECNIQP
jgi:hypothetical protein